MVSKARTEFTSNEMHIGWQGGKPVYAVFSLEMAKFLFEEKKQVIAICIAVPKAARAETFEQAVHFFSDDDVSATIAETIFAV